MLYRLLIAVMLIVSAALAGCGESVEEEAPIPPLASVDSTEVYAFDMPPVLTDFVDPVYPEDAREEGLEGEVRLKLLVDVDGTVADVQVVSSTNPAFETAAVLAARESRFRPAQLDGEPTKSFVMVPVHFRIDG